ncbi:20219_t:CDS:2 [Dentiscutata erythropus]|uniref:20219_t:CDS:1 n=1 Tax=Dentiscutata erythropus TaxID=1348616 RepID=A0A9N9D9Y6_9GLOM|nr:20219_t:CDS:2 [Dentiscutata erythropus]
MKKYNILKAGSISEYFGTTLESTKETFTTTASSHIIFEKLPLHNPDLVAVSAEDPTVLANVVCVQTTGQPYDIIDTHGNITVFIIDSLRLSTYTDIYETRNF